MERFDVDETFVDEFLSAECGVEVTTHLQGHNISGRLEEACAALTA